MAALESLQFSFFRLSNSSNPPLISSATPTFSIPIFTPKLPHKFHPPTLHISRNFQVFSSSSAAAIQEEDISVEQKQKELLQKRLFVLNLPWSFSVDDLKNLFAQCGTLEDAQIIKRKKDGKSRGYAFVTMASREDALSAIEKYDSYELMGRIIRVEFAKDNNKTSPPSPRIPGEKRYKLYVSNLAWRARANHLREFFAADFNPVSTRVVFENPEGKSAGYGFVTFATKEEAESAISTLNGKELLGRPISITFSERGADKSDTKEVNSSAEQPAES